LARSSSTGMEVLAGAEGAESLDGIDVDDVITIQY
jgi:hypothetical protein